MEALVDNVRASHLLLSARTVRAYWLLCWLLWSWRLGSCRPGGFQETILLDLAGCNSDQPGMLTFYKQKNLIGL